MKNKDKHITPLETTVRKAMEILDGLAANAILFLVNTNEQLVGSLTDGDLRRGFIRGLGLDDPLKDFINTNPKHIQQGKYDLSQVLDMRKNHILIFPVLDAQRRIIKVVNLREQKSYLPVDAMIMAGGRGERLKPLTDNTPKPLLKVGDKPIIENNIDRLNTYGVDDVWISLGYLGEQLENHLKEGVEKSMRINYVREKEPLGTAGALGLVDGFNHDDVLLMNSDLLTNLDFEDFYLFHKEQNADITVVCIPYRVNIPYAIMETEQSRVVGFKEKPTMTYFSNGGIYLIKRELLNLIPKNTKFNATDLMENAISEGKKVAAYNFSGYWLDIGKPEDFEQAQTDIKNLK
ncbi:nucleotidyltransferase family protein [Bacteroidia bacterium]|nr:nucleotidyltransferase family protein [Bacteroidia bacterium]